MAKKTEQIKGQAVDLPKNIKQMGNTGGGVRVYLEDYSGIWLRRILTEENIRHGILLGKKQLSGNQTYCFIKAVLAVQAEPKDNGWKYDWNEIYELMQKYFVEEGQEPLEVLGWAMPVQEYKNLDVNELEHMHRANFDGNMTLAFTIDMQDGREQFYILENNKFHSLGGYYIYYEKSKAMQTYVLENQPGPCVETEAIVKGSGESYRTMLLQRKEMLQKRYTVSVLYVASTFLVMIVIVLGITMMNNYEKMKNMQSVLNDLSKSVINNEIQAENIVSSDAIATASGNVTDSENVKETVQAMSSSVVQPEYAQKVENGLEDTVTQTEDSGTESGFSQAQNESQAQPENDKVRKRYEIQPGDTLAAISIRMYNTEEMVDKICEYNDIDNGNQIVAGDVLILP